MAAHIGGRLTVVKVKAAGPGKHPDGRICGFRSGRAVPGRGICATRWAAAPARWGSAPSRSSAWPRRATRRLSSAGSCSTASTRSRPENAARRPQRETVSFEVAAKQYIAGHEAGWSPDHDRQWRSSLARYVYPAIGERAIDSIDTHDVLSMVEPLWQTTTETASRVVNRISLILDWATARKLRSGDNPARWKGHLDAVLPKRSKVQREEHYAALPYLRMPEFIAALRQAPEIGARAAELMILTAVRTGEVRFAAWSEIDLEAAAWTIPAARMKAARDHQGIPLGTAAAAILVGLERRGALVFPALGQHAVRKAVKRIDPAVTAHGFRSTFSDWCAEQTSFPAGFGKWRWRMLSATRSRRPIAVATCSASGGI